MVSRSIDKFCNQTFFNFLDVLMCSARRGSLDPAELVSCRGVPHCLRSVVQCRCAHRWGGVLRPQRPPRLCVRHDRRQRERRGRNALLCLRGDAPVHRYDVHRPPVHRSAPDRGAGHLSFQCTILFAHPRSLPERGYADVRIRKSAGPESLRVCGEQSRAVYRSHGTHDDGGYGGRRRRKLHTFCPR